MFIVFIWGCLNFKIYISQSKENNMQELYLHKGHHIQKSVNLNLPSSETNFSQRPKNNEQSQIDRKCDQTSLHHIYTFNESNEKIIPGYNFQSLFRKKSHIRLARKKAKEETQKKNPNLKHDLAEREAKNIQKGHWTNEENKLYYWFLQLHNRHFVLKYLRRTDKIFKSMANFIRTRQAEQCRSHHQKMQKKYHTFYQILSKLRMDFYGTINTDLLKIDLEEHGYKLKQNILLSEAEIRNGDLIARDGKAEDMEDCLAIGDNQSCSGKEHNNILGQNYENSLHFGNMHY